MSALTNSMISTNNNYPRVPATSESVTTRSSTPFCSDARGSLVADHGSSDDHAEDEIMDEEMCGDRENDLSIGGENNLSHNMSVSSSRRESASSDDYGLFIFNEPVHAEAVTEAETVQQSQEENMDPNELAKVAKAYVNNLTDERVEELIEQIRDRLFERHQSLNHPTRRNSLEPRESDPSRKRDILEAMIRSLGTDWNHFIDCKVMDSLRRMHRAQSSERPSNSIVNQPDNPHVNAARYLQEDGHKRRRRPNQRRRQRNICNRCCIFIQRSYDKENTPLRSRQDHTLGQTNDPKNVNPHAHSEASTEKIAARFRRGLSTININIVMAILVILSIVIVGFVGVFVFFIVNPANVAIVITNKTEITERAAIKLTKIISKSMPISALNAASIRTDYYKDYIVFSTQMANNRSNYDTTFLDEFLHVEAVVNRYVKTNETCAQITVEIICCETFCEGKLKEGYIITRHFPRYSQFCGAWRYEFNTAYFCTRKLDKIRITEFWSAKDFRFSHPTVNIANFQAIEYLPNHVGLILTKNSSNSHQFCLVNFNRRTVKQMKCRDIGFLGLEPMDKSMTRHVVYLQHNVWAVLTSKLEKNYLQWTIYVFKDVQLILKESENLYSADSELVVFGESPIVKVCAIELKINQEDKLVSCTAYKYEML